MLPDAVEEAEAILAEDPVLAEHTPQREALRLSVKSLVSSKRPPAIVEQTRVLLASVAKEYLEWAFVAAIGWATNEPHKQSEMVGVAGAIVSTLRTLGWSDESLLAIHAQASSAAEPLKAIHALVQRPVRKFTCFVSVSFAHDVAWFRPTSKLKAIAKAPTATPGQRPLKQGTHLEVELEAADEWSAAALAHRRVLATLGAATMFLARESAALASDVVGVRVGDGEDVRTFQVGDVLPQEHRRADHEEVARIVTKSWGLIEASVADPLHDAIRLRHRALLAQDSETRLLLLWTGLERITSGARGYDAALSAARSFPRKSAETTRTELATISWTPPM